MENPTERRRSGSRSPGITEIVNQVRAVESRACDYGVMLGASEPAAQASAAYAKAEMVVRRHAVIQAVQAEIDRYSHALAALLPLAEAQALAAGPEHEGWAAVQHARELLELRGPEPKVD